VSNGNFLYVALAGTANANNKIVAFAIDPTSGALTTLPGSPFVAGSDPLYMAIVPVTLGPRAFLYTASVQEGTISAFTANDVTGVLATSVTCMRQTLRLTPSPLTRLTDTPVHFLPLLAHHSPPATRRGFSRSCCLSTRPLRLRDGLRLVGSNDR
jgi:6-phosphogluconolactonase (cycloisomerase 2 family)